MDYDTLDKILTLGDVARILRVHPSTIYRLLKKREIPAFKVGRDWRFNKCSIDHWREELEARAAESFSSRVHQRRVLTAVAS